MQPIAAIARRPRPVSSKFLWLYLMDRAPIMRAVRNDAMEATVLICPITPTETPKDSPMSIISKLNNIVGGCIANLENTSEGSISLEYSLDFDI